MKKLNVLGSKVTVKVKKLADAESGAAWFPETSEIFIGPEENDKYYLLIHEITHALLDRIGSRHTSMDGDLEEIICHANAVVMSENAVGLWQMYTTLKKMK